MRRELRRKGAATGVGVRWYTPAHAPALARCPALARRVYFALDVAGALWFVALFIGLPLAGWLAMVVDLRAQLRRLRGALTIFRGGLSETPLWAIRDRPECLRELGLAPGCTRDEVMAAYRREVKCAHPDRGGDRRRFDRLQQRLHEALRLVAEDST